MFKIEKIVSILLLTLPSVFAQQTLSLDEAISIALEKSYGVQIAKMQNQISDIQAYKGFAGMMPKVDLNSNVGGALNEVNQKLSNGSEINRFGKSLSPVLNASMSWLLYDGKRMYATLDRLRNQSQLSQVQTRQQMEATVINVMRAYYEVTRQAQTVKFLETVIKLYDERLKITEERWQVGKGSKLDYLQSKTDLATQQTELVRAKNLLKNAKIALNNTMTREPEINFDVQELVGVMFNSTPEELKSKARANNKDLQYLKKATDISAISQKEVESLKLPRITLNSSFGYSLSKTNAGLFLYNQNVGLNASVVATWNIFNGEQTRRQIQMSKIQTDILQKQQESTWTTLESDIMQAYYQHQSDKELLKLEEENTKIVEENMQISLEKFKLGSSTILEINEAQRRLDASLNRLVNARYNVKISELELMRLSGELVK